MFFRAIGLGFVLATMTALGAAAFAPHAAGENGYGTYSAARD